MLRLATTLTTGLLFFAAPLWAQIPAGFDQVQGDAFGASVSLLLADSVTTIDVPPEPWAQQPAEGGGGADDQTTLEIDVPDVLGSGTVSAETAGTLQTTLASSSSSIIVEDADLLTGLLTADAISGEVDSEGDGTTASSTVNAEFVNLAITGSPVDLDVPANTAIPVPLLGVILLNEQVPGEFDNGVLTSQMTYHGARVVIDPELLDLSLVEQLVGEGFISLDVVRAILDGVPLPVEILDILGPDGLGLLPATVITAIEVILATGVPLTLDLIETVFEDVLGIPLDLVQELLDLDQLDILLEPVIGGEGLLNVDLLLALIADGTLDVVLGEALADLDLIANISLDLSLVEELLDTNILDLEELQAFVENNILDLELLSGEVIVASAYSGVEFGAPVAGWRLLTAPGDGLTVQDMADRNLVQGVEGSYPDWEFPNFHVNYDGPTEEDYTPAESVEDPLEPGRGFWWYLYSADDFPGDPPPEFTPLAEMVYPEDFGTEVTTDTEVAFESVPMLGPENPVPAYMIGNPYQDAFQLSGVSTDVAGLQTNFFAWNPDFASYVIRGTDDFVRAWQGLFSEVDNEDEAPTYSFAFDSVNDSANPPLIALRTDESFAVDIMLAGTLESGQRVNDLATRLRFEEDAMVEWDRHDGSKFMPPLSTSSYALLSLEGVRNSDTYRQSVRSLPNGLEKAAAIPVTFLATEPGEFTISATGQNIPEGWSFTLRDLETGSETNLLSADYTFTGVAGENWQDRFEVTITPASVVGSEDGSQTFRLSHPAPNPAMSTTALVLQVDNAQPITARVYDALGRLVTTAYDGTLAADEEVRLAIDTSGLAAGAYVVRVEGDSFAETRRFTVVR